MLGRGVAPVTVSVKDRVPVVSPVDRVSVHVTVSLTSDVTSLFAVAHAVVPSVMYGKVPFQT
jgi:hypothetical protein